MIMLQIAKAWSVIAAAALSLVVTFAAGPATAQSPARRSPPTADPSMAASSPMWRFQLTPYLWASGLKGQVGVGGRTVQVDVGFSELIEHLDGAVMLAGGAWRGAWGAAFEIMYVSLSGQSATPGPLFTDAELDAKQLMLESTGRYRILPRDPVTVDLLAGSRYWRLSNSLDLTEGDLPGTEFSDTESWFDPVVGLTAVAHPGPRWLVQAGGDIGGFSVGSDLTWQLLGVLGYRFSDLVDVKAGYRYLDVDYSSGGFTFDVGMAGFITGVTLNF